MQVINREGVLEFGTEVVSAGDRSLAALLGASPGASTAVSIMFNLLQRCFPAEMRSEGWLSTLRQLIPSYGHSLADDQQLLDEIRASTGEALGLAA